jgi:hypothetical protein
LELLTEYFEKIEIRTQKVFEKDDNHTHHIFELVGFCKK